jgi:MFS family permease
MDTNVVEKPASKPKKGAKFWLIFLALCLTLFLSALEYMAVPNALPVIIHDLEGREFEWIGTAYGLASTAFIPLSGNMAEVQHILLIS